jgi:hypothetical protein
MGLAMVASLAMSLIGVSVPNGIPSVAAQCAFLEDCDYDAMEGRRAARGEGADETQDYPTPTPWELEERRQNAFVDAHLAAEKAVATWWRCCFLNLDVYEIESRGGALKEMVPNGIPGDALYPISGRVSNSSGTEFVHYDCDPNYGDAQSGGCVPADRDYDCAELRSWGIAGIPVIGEDWMLLDDDGDGQGCEPLITVQAAQTVAPTAEPTKQCEGILGMLGCLADFVGAGTIE